MTPRQYVELAKERWKAIVGCVLLGLLAAGGVAWTTPPEYTSSVTMVASGRPSPDLASAVEGDQLSSQRMQTYIQMLTSARLADEVASDLRLAVSGDELAERVTASAEPETILLTATVTDEVPARAAEIANRLATRFIQDVAQVERPADPALAPLVTVKVFEPAVPATDPESPRTALTLALGGAIGLVVGIAVAAARHGLDTRVRNRRRLGAIVAAPVLGELSTARHAASAPLPMRDAARGRRAEEYRWVRTNLEHAVSGRGSTVIMVTSPSTGDGKTTVACNLACALAAAGRRVLVVEADLRSPAASDLFVDDPGIGLTDVLAGRARLGVVVQQWWKGVDGVASGPLPTHPGETLGSVMLPRLLADARAHYDVVLVDTAAMLPVADTAAIVPHTDGVLLVVRRGTAAPAVVDATEALAMVSGTVLGTVLTMCPPRRARGGGTTVVADRGPRAPEPAPWPVIEPPSANGSARPTGGAPTNGGLANGGLANGGLANGGLANGGPANGGPANGGPATSTADGGGHIGERDRNGSGDGAGGGSHGAVTDAPVADAPVAGAPAADAPVAEGAVADAPVAGDAVAGDAVAGGGAPERVSTVAEAKQGSPG